MKAKYIFEFQNQNNDQYKNLVKEFLFIRESLNEENIIPKIKKAISKGIKISMIVSALISAGYTPIQAKTNIEKAGIEVNIQGIESLLQKTKKSKLQNIIKELKREGYKITLGQNPLQQKNLENKEIKQQKFVGATQSAIDMQKTQFFRKNNIRRNNTLDLSKITNNKQIINIVLYSVDK